MSLQLVWILYSPFLITPTMPWMLNDQYMSINLILPFSFLVFPLFWKGWVFFYSISVEEKSGASTVMRYWEDHLTSNDWEIPWCTQFITNYFTLLWDIDWVHIKYINPALSLTKMFMYCIALSSKGSRNWAKCDDSFIVCIQAYFY